MRLGSAIAVCLAPLWAAAGVPPETPGTATRPNIVFILADDLGWSDLGGYGSDLHETPHIDGLAAEGVRFTSAYAAAPVCTPTRASIMTGQYPARLHTTVWFEASLDPPRDRRLVPPATVGDLSHEHLTVAEALRDAGYATTHVGKWHLGDAAHYPETHGFDVNIGGSFWGAPPTYFYPYRGAFGSRRELRYVPDLPWGQEGEYLTDRLTDEAITAMRRAGDRPFFLHLAYHSVHTPIEAKPEIVELYARKVRPEAQTDAAQVRALVEPRLIPPDVVAYQAMQHLMSRVPPFDVPTTREAWESEARGIRGHLTELILSGWPQEYVDADPGFTETGVIADPGAGYRIRKLRYEIVPGFYAAALLYEPDGLEGRVPAILNVNGHGWNKAIEWKQKRCINQAKRGMLALNLEWIYYGELEHPENKHWFGPHLDLVGANGMGLFYLAMQRGLDYLYGHPNVDRRRIGMTGLSGGGWQTIVLSALDERVAAAVPVAGFSGFESRIERGGGGDIGDFEQKGSDFVARYDYPHLVALLAPRPALLIHNADDIFRSHLVKRRIFDDVRPVWQLYDAEDRFAFHENLDPGDHNYALENRLEAYRFFARAFAQPPVEEEIATGDELKTADELTVGLPEDNLTLLGLARRLARGIERKPLPGSDDARRDWAPPAREDLGRVVRPPTVALERAWTLHGTRLHGLETRAYRFDFSNGLSAAGVWLHAMWGRRDPGGVTIVLHDEGRAAAAPRISDQVNRGEPVLALDLLFTGDAGLDLRGSERTIQAFAGLGDRPLGLRVAQLRTLAHWVRSTSGAGHVRLETTGLRSQVVALVAAALEPEAFSELAVHDGISSLQQVLDVPVMHADAPELFCLDLYRQFDLDRLEALAGIPTRTEVAPPSR